MSAATQTVSLASLILKHGIRCEATYGGRVPDDWGSPGAHPYKCTLRMGRKRLTVPFYMSVAHTREPSALDVLSCLLMDSSAADEPFESWAENFGLNPGRSPTPRTAAHSQAVALLACLALANPDSRKAERTYRACLANARKVRRFLGENFETFRYAEMP